MGEKIAHGKNAGPRYKFLVPNGGGGKMGSIIDAFVQAGQAVIFGPTEADDDDE